MAAPPSIVVFDIGNVLIEWSPRRLYGKLVGKDSALLIVNANAKAGKVMIDEEYKGKLVKGTADTFPICPILTSVAEGLSVLVDKYDVRTLPYP